MAIGINIEKIDIFPFVLSPSKHSIGFAGQAFRRLSRGTTNGLGGSPWVLCSRDRLQAAAEPITRQGTEEHHMILHVKIKGFSKTINFNETG